MKIHHLFIGLGVAIANFWWSPVVFGQCSHQASFTATLTHNCTNVQVSFNNTSTAPNSATYAWDFGDGGTSTAKNPNRTYSPAVNDITYTVRLIVTANGCKDTAFQDVRIMTNIAPVPSFTMPAAVQCAPLVHKFDASGSNPGASGITISQYLWTIDGVPSLSPVTTRTFDKIGTGSQTHTVELQLTNSIGCGAALPLQSFVVKERPGSEVITAPAALKSCSGAAATVTLFNNSSTAATNTGYQINWGANASQSGTVSYPANFVSDVASYAASSGFSTIVFTAMGSNGCNASANLQFFNGKNPAVGLNIPGGTVGLCAPASANFDITGTQNNPPGTIYTVETSDGSTPDTFNHPPPPFYNHTFSLTSCGAATANQQNAYFIRITATNPCDNSIATVEPIRVGTPPVVGLTISEEVACVGTAVSVADASWGATNPTFNACDTAKNQQWAISPATGWVASSPAWSILDNFNLTFTAAGVYTITHIVSNQCGADTISQDICVVPQPVASFVPSPAAGIAPSTFQLTNTSNTLNSCEVAYKWTITPIADNFCAPEPTAASIEFVNGTTDSSVSPDIRLLTAGDYIVELQVTNTCSVVVFRDTLSAVALPRISFAPSNGGCAKDELFFAAIVDDCYGDITSYQWQFPGGTPSSFNGLTPPSVRYNAAGSYTITLKATNLAGTAIATTTVVIKGLPNAPVLTSNSPICADETLQLTATSASNVSNFAWTRSSNGWSSSQQNPSVAPTHAVGVTTYTLDITDALTGCHNRDSVLVVVDSLPVIQVNAALAALCNGDSTTLQAAGADVYLWQPAASLGIATGSMVTAFPSNTTTYTVTGANSFGCASSANLTITVKPTPNLNLNAIPTAVCQNTITNLSPSPSGGSWQGKDVLASGTFQPSDTGSYLLTYYYQNPTTLCDNRKSVEICVIPTVTAHFSLDKTSGCAPLSVQTENLSSTIGSSCGGGLYNWSVTFTGAACAPNIASWAFANSTGATSAHPVFVFQRAGDYTISLSINTDCGTGTFSQVVHVSDVPTVAIAPLAPACNADTILPTASFSDCYEAISGFGWSFPTAANASSANTQTPPAVVYATQGTHPIIASATNLCGTGVDTFLFVVNPLPAPPPINANQPCEGNTLFLSTTANVPVYQWSGPNGWASSLQNPTRQKAKASTVGTYYLAITDVNGCQNTDSIAVTIRPVPTVSVGNDFSTCLNASPQTLVPTVSIAGNGAWLGAGVNTSNSSFTPAIAGIGSHPIVYIHNANNGCLGSDTLIASVDSVPPIFLQADTVLCDQPVATQIRALPAGGYWAGQHIDGAGIFTPNGVGNFGATYFYNDGQCANSGVVNIAVGNVPTVSAGSDVSLCFQAMPIVLQATPTDATSRWAGYISSTGVFAPDSVGVFKILLTNGYGTCEVQDSLTVTVHALPTVTAAPDTVVCADEPTFQLVGLPMGGTWSSNSGVIPVGGGFYVFAPVLATKYFNSLVYTFVDANGCSNSDTVGVTVNKLPTLQAQADTVLCNQPIGTQLRAQPNNAVWTGANTTSDGIFTPNGLGNFVLYLSFDDGLCTARDSMTVTVTGAPVANAGTDISACLLSSDVTLAGLPADPTGRWNGLFTTLNGVFSPAQIGIFDLIYTVGYGTCEVADTLSAEVYALPTVNVGIDRTACLDSDTLFLTSTPSAVRWSGKGIVGDSTGAFLAGQGFIGFNTVVATFTDANLCVNTDTLLVRVDTLPTLAMPNALLLCNQPIDTQLIALPMGGTWSGFGMNASGVYTPQDTGAFRMVYSYGDGNCLSRDSVEVRVVLAETPFAGNDTSVCIFVPSFQLRGFPYDPTFGIGYWRGQHIAADGTFSPDSAGTFVVYYQYGVGTCKVTDSLQVTVNALPALTAGLDRTACLDADTLFLTSTPNVVLWSGKGIVGDSTGAFLAGQASVGLNAVVATFTDANLCVNSDTLLMRVDTLPTLAMPTALLLCNQPIDTQLVALPMGGVWLGFGISASGIYTPQDTGAFTITYRYGDGNCLSIDSAVVNVVMPPTVSAGLNDTLCYDQGLYSLTNFSPATGATWAGLGLIDTINGIFDPTLAGAGLHPLTLRYSAGTCYVEDVKTAFVTDLTAADAGQNQVICLSEPAFLLTGFSPLGGSWSGNGIVDSTGVFDASAAGAGVHPLTYTYKDSVSGCTVVRTKQINVLPMPIPLFNLPAEGCKNTPLTLFNNSLNVNTLAWDFGDGTSATSYQPVHTFGDTGSYTVRLLTTSAAGCVDSLHRTIHISEPPTAAFSMDVNKGCAVLNVQFTNLSAGYQAAYQWNFGNSQSDTVAQPVAPVSYGGGVLDTFYLPTLTVSNHCGTVQFRDTVFVDPLPIVNISPNVLVNCSPMTTIFINATSGSPTQYFWDYGNGNTATDSVPMVQTYFTDTLPTTYLITLVAANSCGTDTGSTTVTVYPNNVNAFFTPSTVEGCEPLAVQFQSFHTPGATVTWDFGDGSGAATANTSHEFDTSGVFEVVQYVSNGCGFDSATTQITVFEKPDVVFSHTLAICDGATAFFQNQTTGIVGTLWDFGDGQTSQLHHPSHAYQGAGTYFITLTTFADTTACPASATSAITVVPKPAVAFAPSAQNGCAPHNLVFQNSSAGIFNTWDFGDGNTSNLVSPAHTYDSAGSYTVRLTTTDANGCSASDTFYFINVHPDPQSNFTAFVHNLCQVPTQVSLTNTSEGAVGYQWSLGDGRTSTNNNIITTYSDTGSFVIQLIATSGFGCGDTSYRSIAIRGNAVADFDWNIAADNCQPVTVLFNQQAQYAQQFFWNFGDGTTSTLPNPAHTYTQAGTYDVSLAVSTDSICADTVLIVGAVAVYPTPTASFIIKDSLNDGTIHFINTSADADAFLWDLGDGTSSALADPVHQYSFNGAKTVQLIAYNQNGGCADTTLQVITPSFFKGLFVPNAFSPAAGVGDVRLWRPVGVGLETYRAEVYSPWGELLWQSEALDENGMPTESWDGTNLNGDQMPQGGYVWKINAIFRNGAQWEGQQSTLSQKRKIGSVTLLR